MNQTLSIEELKNKINYHNKKYWEEHNPEISDIEYDKLVNLYISKGGDLSFINKIPNSNLLNGNKIKHDIPMLSLDKVYSIPDLIKWLQKISRSPNEEFYIQPKLDGWACKITKDKLLTRGDGEYGEDISIKLPLIDFKLLGDFPKNNEYIIGELVVTKETFKTYKSQLLRSNNQEYKTTRNVLSGLLSSKDTKVYKFKPITFLEYNLFNNLKYSLSDLQNADNNFWKNIEQNAKDCIYPLDGLVIKLVDNDYFNSLGTTSHHPKGAIALKFTNPTGISKLINVEWFCGKNNTLNPVGIVNPVEINGHTISRVNLHNMKNIKDLDLHIGDDVIIERCGEIIPDILEIIPGIERKEIILEVCPNCESLTQYIEPFLYCSNNECSGALSKKLHDSCVRIGIENLGPATIEKMIDIGCDNLYDILHLSKNELYQLPGFSDISVNNLYNELQRIRTTEILDYKLLSSLNINGIGIEICKKILSKYTISELFEISINELELIEGIGYNRAIDLNIALDYYKSELIELMKILIIKDTKGTINNLPKICFTGKMDKERSYYEELARSKGYNPVSTVTSDLALLVTSDLNSTKSKMKKAQKLGVKIIHINDFIVN